MKRSNFLHIDTCFDMLINGVMLTTYTWLHIMSTIYRLHNIKCKLSKLNYQLAKVQQMLYMYSSTTSKSKAIFSCTMHLQKHFNA